MHEKIINPKIDIYPATQDYVHALEISNVKRTLFVSGTMGLDKNGIAPKEIDQQLDLVWANLRKILAKADMTTSNIVRVTSYLTKLEFAERNQNARLKALGERRVPTTAIIVQTLNPEWLIEIEIIAVS